MLPKPKHKLDFPTELENQPRVMGHAIQKSSSQQKYDISSDTLTKRFKDNEILDHRCLADVGVLRLCISSLFIV